MVVKKLIGKIVVALIKALVRALFGMLVGIALIGLILIMLLFFGFLMPEIGGIMEILSLLIVGAGVGAIVGFFDLLDIGAKRSRSQESSENSKNNLPQNNGRGPLGSMSNNRWQSTSSNSRGQP